MTGRAALEDVVLAPSDHIGSRAPLDPIPAGTAVEQLAVLGSVTWRTVLVERPKLDHEPVGIAFAEQPVASGSAGDTSRAGLPVSRSLPSAPHASGGTAASTASLSGPGPSKTELGESA